MRKPASIAIVIALSVVLSAQTSAADKSLPVVLCKKPSKPGEVKPTDRGVYSYRPHVCVLEYFDAPAPQPVFVPILAMKWKRWETSSAYGTGEYSIEWVNFVTGVRGHTREPIHVTLSHPRSICGHEVFTAARLIKPYGTFNEPTQLDRVPVLGRGCAEAPRARNDRRPDGGQRSLLDRDGNRTLTTRSRSKPAPVISRRRSLPFELLGAQSAAASASGSPWRSAASGWIGLPRR